MNVKPSKKGWIVTKHGKPINTPDITKHGLLVGYDMMPMRGLRKAEKDLRTPPHNIRRVVLEYAEKSKLYGAAIDGRISLKWAAFSNIYDSIERTKMSTAFAISGYPKESGLSKEDDNILSMFFYLFRDAKTVRLPRDKREKKRLLYLRLETERIFEELKVVIVPVKYVLLT